jgi:GAF domain-containing protein
MKPFVNTAFDDDALSVAISELLVATADGADPALGSAVPEVLRLLRDRLGMDAVFVGEFVGDQRVFRFIDSVSPEVRFQAGDAHALEASYCQRVVDGRLPERVADLSTWPGREALPATPFAVGAHLSTPVVLSDGRTYGTLCCFSHAPKPELRERDLTQLRHCAQLVARKVEAGLAAPRSPAADWTLTPVEKARR